MEAFCHSLTKAAGSLHVRTEDNYLDLTIILRDRVFLAGVSLDANPQARQLLEPCDSVEVILQRNKVTVLANGDDVIKNTVVDQSEAREALTQITKSFCKLSRTHAEILKKRREVKDFRDEAVECLDKIEQRHREDFTKFILILNEKKKKIRELQRKLGIRTEDPEDLDDDIGVKVSDDAPSQSKKARVSDQLAIEGPSTSTSQPTTQSKGEAGNDGGADETGYSDDEELLSDEEHSDRAPSEVEEIDEDDPPTAKTSPVKKEAEEKEDETKDISKEIKEEKMSLDDDQGPVTDHPSPKRVPERPSRRKPSPKKFSLDMLDDLL